MTELARGEVGDRLWGLTLGALGLRALTGRLELRAEDKRYAIAFEGGAVVGASSPLPSDSAVRVAVTNALVTTTQVGEITRRLAAAPQRDEIEVIADAAKLSDDKAERLRRRVIAQRAARTFAIERGEFVVTDTPPADTRCTMDVRPIIYLGAMTNISDERMRRDLAGLGAYFRLKPEVVADLPQYGFTEEERRIATTLQAGASVAELTAKHRELDARTVRAIVYTLVAGRAVEILGATPARAPEAPVLARLQSDVDPNVSFKRKGPAPASAAPPEPPPIELLPEPSFVTPPAVSPVPVSVPVAPPVFELEPEPIPEPAAAAPSVTEPLIDDAIEVFAQLELVAQAPPPEATEATATPIAQGTEMLATRPKSRTNQLLTFVAIPRAPAASGGAEPPAAPASPPSSRSHRETPPGPLMAPRKPAKP